MFSKNVGLITKTNQLFPMSTSSAKNFCVTFPGDKHPHKPDFTICGGGTTALCLANSLSSKGYRVLVLEAGKDHSDNPIVQNPFELSTYYDGTLRSKL